MHQGDKYVHIFIACGPNRPLKLVYFIPIEVPGELNPLSFHNLCVDVYVNKTKFERNSSLEYYRMTCIGKTKHTS